MSLLEKNWLSSELDKVEQSTAPDANYDVDDSKQYRQFGIEKYAIHPLVLLIHEVRNSLRPFDFGIMVKETQKMVNLSNIADDISIMNINMTSNKEKFSNLVSSDFSLYEKTLYEIQTASNFVKLGYNTNFIKVSSKKTPDILVNNDVEVECKKKSLYPINSGNSESWKSMTRKVWELMDNIRVNYRLVIQTEKNLSPDVVKRISSEVYHIVKERKEGRFRIPELGLTIQASLLLPYDKVCEGNIVSGDDLPTIFGFKSGIRQIVWDCKYMPRPNNSRTPKLKNIRMLGFKLGELPSPSIISNMRDAARQFSGQLPGIVYVDLSDFNRIITKTYLEKMNTSILKQLKLSNKISALVLTSRFNLGNTEYDDIHEGIYVIRNQHAKNKLDNSFLIPKENESSLPGLISSTYLDEFGRLNK